MKSHNIFFAILCAFICASPLIRLYSGVIFIVLWFFSIIFSIYWRSFFVSWSLIIFTLTGVFYIALSFADILPDSWTLFYDRSLIIRQGFFVVALYPLLIAFRELWIFIVKSRNPTFYFLCLFVCAAVIAQIVVRIHIDWDQTEYGFFTLDRMGALSNGTMPVYLCLSYFICIRFYNLFWILAPISSLITFTQTIFLQNKIVSVALMMFGFIKNFHILITLLIVSAILFSMIGLFFIPELGEIDPNISVRLIFLKDAMEALRDTWGIGVGFGKESLTEFGSETVIPFRGDPEEENYISFMMTSIHNSFMAMFYRIGLVGGGAFCWFFFFYCFPKKTKIIDIDRHISFIYFAIFMSLLSNVAIESPAYIVGIALALGYVLACKSVYQTVGRQEIRRLPMSAAMRTQHLP